MKERRDILVDTHAHLHMSEFDADLDAVMRRAREAGVGHVVSASIDLPSLRRNLEIAGARSDVSVTAGLHPNDAATGERDWEEIARAADSPAVVAIGETGLDFYRDRCPRDKQIEIFLRHISLARRLGKPLVVHSRAAEEMTLDILEREKAFETGGVLHCFSGSPETARRATSLGFFLSVAGPVTYPRSTLPEALRAVASDFLLVETDAPYLPPQSQRGRRNEPAFVAETARAVASIKGLSEGDVARITTFNARALFRLPGGKAGGEIAYPIRDSLYLNVTNRCTNSCAFCRRESNPVVKGHNLHLEGEPTAQEILMAAGDVSAYREVVFCGYGEPLLRWEVVREVAREVKKRGGRVRINTNGQSGLFLGRDVLPEMQGTVDALSVSLNAADAGHYARLCRPEEGEEAYAAVKKFIAGAKLYVPEVTATVVTAPGVDVEACRRVAEEELGVKFRARPYDEVG